MNSSVIKEVDKPISKVGSIEISQEKKPIDWRIESKFSGFVNVTLSGWFSGIMDGIFEGTLNNMQIPLPKESFVGHIEGEFVGNAFGQMNGSAFGEGNYSRVWVPIYPPSAPASFLYSEDSIINIVPSVQFSDYESMIHPESFGKDESTCSFMTNLFLIAIILSITPFKNLPLNCIFFFPPCFSWKKIILNLFLKNS